jgi:hypothetical protein
MISEVNGDLHRIYGCIVGHVVNGRDKRVNEPRAEIRR